MGLVRGFKAEAEALSASVRGELGIGPYDRLDPRRLAGHLCIPILTLSDLASTTSGANYFLQDHPDVFSAVTVFEGPFRAVIHNDAHSLARQNSNLAHELAHSLLFHEPTPALDYIAGSRTWNSTHEAEAAWLAGALLVPSQIALATARGTLTEQHVRERLGVSKKMLDWRLKVTGAYIRAKREREMRAG
ncbi:ImmA/IrrE family metallo-endopeptidase [Candidatus Spongiisocius sp.]|uniref:ImmA/IrrE family metallo-endopeptidase n=1 Tax=Candidatus Spongiisocius sp. TaxID=3101273 RepID=UPI003B5C204B